MLTAATPLAEFITLVLAACGVTDKDRYDRGGGVDVPFAGFVSEGGFLLVGEIERIEVVRHDNLSEPHATDSSTFLAQKSRAKIKTAVYTG